MSPIRASHRRALAAVPVFLILSVLLVQCAQESPPAPAGPQEAMFLAPDLEQRLTDFAPTIVEADLASLSESERAVLDKLIEAAHFLDEIFLLQAWPQNPAFRRQLAGLEEENSATALAYFDLMYGPWDRRLHRETFAGDHPHPPGAGFYPEDLSQEELEAYIGSHPDSAGELLSWYTVVKRDADNLVALPYSEMYREQLEPAAELLREAAGLTENESLRKFLELRAEAFLTDDYYESEKAWMDLDSRVEVTIGPYEVYEDELMATKTAFEAFVTVSDPEASENLGRYKSLLPAMEKHLPIPDELKTERGGESPIRVVDIAFTGGDTRAGIQTIAFNLPNDERIRAEKGSKKVLLRNVMKAKFEQILRPIAERLIDPSQIELLSADGFFNETLFHELSHGLGPAYVTDSDQVEVRAALQEHYSHLEEGKADVMGAYNVLYMIDRELFPEDFRDDFLLTYFAGLFRSVRFGTSEAHGKGAAVQLNYFLERDAAAAGEDGRYTVDLEVLESAIGDLVREMCLIQAAGDKDAAAALLSEKGELTAELRQALSRLDGIPVDIRPVYTAAGETLPD